MRFQAFTVLAVLLAPVMSSPVPEANPMPMDPIAKDTLTLAAACVAAGGLAWNIQNTANRQTINDLEKTSADAIKAIETDLTEITKTDPKNEYAKAAQPSVSGIKSELNTARAAGAGNNAKQIAAYKKACNVLLPMQKGSAAELARVRSRASSPASEGRGRSNSNSDGNSPARSGVSSPSSGGTMARLEEGRGGIPLTQVTTGERRGSTSSGTGSTGTSEIIRAFPAPPTGGNQPEGSNTGLHRVNLGRKGSGTFGRRSLGADGQTARAAGERIARRGLNRLQVEA